MNVNKNTALKGNTLISADLRRMFKSSRLWIFLGICLVVPILILTMTSGFGGNEGAMFHSAWDMIGSSGAGMEMTAMMNINLLYFLAGVFICLFVADDFRGGYAKNLFTIHAKKGKYVAAKTFSGILAGALMLITFFIGTVLGGSFAGLSFSLGTGGVIGLAMCMIAKVLLMGVMVPIFLAAASFGRGRSWLSILISLFVGMLLFMIIPMMSPINAGPMNVLLCAAGAVMFIFAAGALSNVILKKSDLV